MIDFNNFRIMHPHGKDWAEMRPREHHDPSDHDPERAWEHGARIFKCATCDEEIRIVPRDESATER